MTVTRSSFVGERWPLASARAHVLIRTFAGHNELYEYELLDPPGISGEMLILWPRNEGRWERTWVRLGAEVGVELAGGCARLGAEPSP